MAEEKTLLEKLQEAFHARKVMEAVIADHNLLMFAAFEIESLQREVARLKSQRDNYKALFEELDKQEKLLDGSAVGLN